MTIHRSTSAYQAPSRSLGGVVLVMLVALGFLFFYGIGGTGLFDVDEAIFAQASKEMLESRDYIAITYNGEPRFHKPPLIYWLQSISMDFFGANAFAARLPSALFGLLTIFAMYSFTDALTRNTRFALTAAAVLGLNISFLVVGHAATADMVMNFLILCATLTFLVNIYAKERKTMPLIIGGLIMALAVMVKGPVTFFVPAVVVGTAVLARPNVWYNLKCVNPFVAAFAFLAGLAPWFKLVVQEKGLDYLTRFLNEFWFVHNVSRFSDGFGNTQSDSAGYYLVVLLIGFFPWVLLLPSALAWILPRFKESIRSDKLSEALPALGLVWMVAVLVLFSFSATKLPHYIVPALPGAALLIAGRLEVLDQRPVSPWHWLYMVPFVVLFSAVFFILRDLPQTLVGEGPYWLREKVSALAEMFGATYPIDHPLEVAMLSQNVVMDMGPVMMGALLVVGLLIGLTFLSGKMRQGVVVMAVTMWLFLALLLHSVVPAAYAYLQAPLARLAAQVAQAHNPKSDGLYMVGVHVPSVRFLSGVPHRALDTPAQIKQIRPVPKVLRFITNVEKRDAVLAQLAPSAQSVCDGGYCLITIRRSH